MHSHEYPDPLKRTPNINYERVRHSYSPGINYTRNKMYDDEKVSTRSARAPPSHPFPSPARFYILPSLPRPRAYVKSA